MADNATLVHEIAHACMLEHNLGGDNLNILNDDGSLDRKAFQRRRVNKFQIRKMARLTLHCLSVWSSRHA